MGLQDVCMYAIAIDNTIVTSCIVKPSLLKLHGVKLLKLVICVLTDFPHYQL